jgi:hypothetical protein
MCGLLSVVMSPVKWGPLWCIVDVGDCLILCIIGRFVLPWKAIEVVTVKYINISLCLWGLKYMDPRFLNHCTTWRRVGNFMHQTQGNRRRYTLNRRLGGPQNLSGPPGEEKNYWPYRGENLDRPAHSQTLHQLPRWSNVRIKLKMK